MKKLFLYSLAVMVTIIVLIEIAVRFSGMTDFPLYDANNEIGYVPKPSQAGTYFRKHHWQFNAKSMDAGEFAPSDAIDNLLIGDSVVFGKAYRQKERLGPQLAQVLKQTVWPISAGSWSLRNELAYLRLHPEVVNSSDRIIFVLNKRDFEQASSWKCETARPRSRTLFATLYVIKKYVYDWESCEKTPEDLLVPNGNWKIDLHQFLSSEVVHGKQVLFFLYPDQMEASGKKPLEKDLERYAAEMIKVSSFPVAVYSVGRDSRWHSGLYRDGMHPSVEGTKVLAAIIGFPEPASKRELPRAGGACKSQITNAQHAATNSSHPKVHGSCNQR